MSPNCTPGSQLKRGFDLLIRCTSGSRVVFRQQRPGRHGEIFTMYEFRTMRPPSPSENPWTTDGLRLTRVGRFLRRPVLMNCRSSSMSSADE